MPGSEREESGRVIRAQVRARLLGLHLLTIDAHIDVRPPGSTPEPRAVRTTRRQPHLGRRRAGRLERGQLGQAALLLAEGDQHLDEARGLRHRLNGAELGAT
jgi:hypothetical protein